jgi:RimJ/RimL family protein N-acetyltransferase
MSERVRLRDGSVVLIRPLEAGDRDALGAAIMRLSERSRYLRFASPMPVLSSVALNRLLDLDHLHREALVAFDPVTGDGVAVARYAEIRGEPDAVDLAVTVNDAWQRRGLGLLLLTRIIDRAGANGYRVVRGSVLVENRASRALLRAAGFRVRGREGLLIEFEREVGWLPLPVAS